MKKKEGKKNETKMKTRKQKSTNTHNAAVISTGVKIHTIQLLSRSDSNNWQ